MSVAANQLIKEQAGCLDGFPVAASIHLYEGTLAFITVAGYLTDVTGSGANRFAGIVKQEKDNSSGSSGDLKAEVLRRGNFELQGSGFTQASVGLPVFATDNFTLTLAPSASAVRVGTIVEYISATKVMVRLDVDQGGGGVTSTVQTKTADYTVLASESGRSFSNVGAAGAITFAMPPAVPGLKYRFRVGVAQQLRIDPDGTETVSLPSTGVPGAAGKYLVADAIGESVDLECVVAGTWTVFGYTGTWTAEA